MYQITTILKTWKQFIILPKLTQLQLTFFPTWFLREISENIPTWKKYRKTHTHIHTYSVYLSVVRNRIYRNIEKNSEVFSQLYNQISLNIFMRIMRFPSSWLKAPAISFVYNFNFVHFIEDNNITISNTLKNFITDYNRKYYY